MFSVPQYFDFEKKWNTSDSYTRVARGGNLARGNALVVW